MADEPLVSVVVPVFNAEKHLGQALDSLLAQTHGNLEVICVDDGSTDGTPQLLADYASRDDRIRVFNQENAGPGAARNRGIERARGDYLYFLDADDWCDPSLLEKAVALLERTGADIAALPHCEFDERYGVPLRASWSILRDKFPAEVVTWRDNPDWVLESFGNFPWNKVLRMDFVRDNHLLYQEIYLTEDLMFCAPALVLAKGIAQLDQALVYHRKGTGENTMAGKDRHPLDFLSAFLALRAWLEERGLYEPLEAAYLNWAAGGCQYNLNTLNTYDAFKLVYDTLARGGARDLGLIDADPALFQSDRNRAFVEDLRHLTADEYLFSLYATTEDIRQRAVYRAAVRLDEIRDLKNRLAKAEKDAKAGARAKKSAEYRVGRAVCRLPRKIQRIARDFRKGRS